MDYHDRQERVYRLLAPLYDCLVESHTAAIMRAGAQLLARHGGLRGRSVLDVGTGTGNLALALSAEGAAVTAVDRSSAFLAVARRKLAASGIPVLEMDAAALAFGDRSFDWVCASMMLHELPERVRDRILAEMVRVSRLGLLLIDYGRGRPAPWGTAFIERLEGSHYRSYLAYPLETRLAALDAPMTDSLPVGQMQALVALRAGPR